MGIFNIFGKDESAANPQRSEPDSALASAATGLVQRLLTAGIDGWGTFDSARQVADTAQGREPQPEKAVDDIVNDHTKLAAGGGFITGLGGIITLPVALPANVLGFYILATRMSAAIAKVRGYDIGDPRVRSAVLLALIGADASDVLHKAGYAAGGGTLASFATKRLPAPILMAVNKGVGFRMATQLGRKSFARLGRGVPLVGGALGAGIDGYMIRRIASHVRSEFPPKSTLDATAIADG